MDIAPIAIISFVVLFAAALRWATSGYTGSVKAPSPDEHVGKTS
ncbi:MAG TPA: hypothetical protein VGD64_14450 [Acidisarcina sp.]